MSLGTKKKKKKRKVTKGDQNTDLLLGRALLFLGANQLELDHVFSCNLAPVPTSLFWESGDARYVSRGIRGPKKAKTCHSQVLGKSFYDALKKRRHQKIFNTKHYFFAIFNQLLKVKFLF